MDQPQQTESPDAAVGLCNWHPSVETRLSCSQCGKRMCTECLVQVPVGIRCRDCGKAVKMPTFDVQPTFYARAICVGIGIAIGGGLLWRIANLILREIGLGFLGSLFALGLGYAAAEMISKSVNSKRSKGLAWIGALSIASAYVLSLLFSPVGGPYGLIFVGVGIYYAVVRLR